MERGQTYDCGIAEDGGRGGGRESACHVKVNLFLPAVSGPLTDFSLASINATVIGSKDVKEGEEGEEGHEKAGEKDAEGEMPADEPAQLEEGAPAAEEEGEGAEKAS